MLNQKLIDKKVKIADEFNSCFRKMINKNKNMSNDEKTIELSKKALIAIGTNPDLGLNILGPYLDKYEHDIINNNIDFFMNMDYKQIAEGDNKETAEYLSKIVKNNWEKINDDEKKDLIDMFHNMVNFYNKFDIVCQQIEFKTYNDVIFLSRTFSGGSSKNRIAMTMFNDIVENVSLNNKSYYFKIKLRSREYVLSKVCPIIACQNDFNALKNLINEFIINNLKKEIPNNINVYMFS